MSRYTLARMLAAVVESQRLNCTPLPRLPETIPREAKGYKLILCKLSPREAKECKLIYSKAEA